MGTVPQTGAQSASCESPQDGPVVAVRQGAAAVPEGLAEQSSSTAPEEGPTNPTVVLLDDRGPDPEPCSQADATVQSDVGVGTAAPTPISVDGSEAVAPSPRLVDESPPAVTLHTAELPVEPRSAPSPQETPPPSPLDSAEPVAPRAPAPAQPRVLRQPQRIPNASVGKGYSLNVASLCALGAADHLSMDSLPAGLTLGADFTLSGSPTESGEYRLPWHTPLANEAGVLLLTINPDPRSLWLDKESNRGDRYWKADRASAFDASSDAFVAVGSVRGRAHAHIGSFRDDDFGLFVPPDEPNGWHLVCVADGAGSAKSSRHGSKLACEAMIAKLRDELVDRPSSETVEFSQTTLSATEADKTGNTAWGAHLYRVLASAAFHAQSVVRAEALANAVSIKEYATTLLASIFRRTLSGAWFVATYWVGDGAIGMWKAGWAAPKLFGEPDAGEFAGQTTFLTSENFADAGRVFQRVRFSVVDDFDFLVLMTDGVSDPKFDTEQQLKSARPWSDFAADLQEVTTTVRRGDPKSGDNITEWMQFWSQGNHDDRTMLIVVPREFARGELG